MRNTYRTAAVGALVSLGVLIAGPASAHVEVAADKTAAGATNVTLTFSGEAESDDAGIASERVVLPEGIAPAGVSLVEAPAGWRFARTADGFTVGGKALRVGTDARWSVKVAKLPDGATRLSFRTLETYGDGQVSRWIEIQQPGEDEPENPAPLVTLKPGPSTAPATSAAASPAASPALSSAPAGAPAVVNPPSPQATTAQAVPASSDSDGSSSWWIWVIAVVVVLLGAGAFVLSRRRRP